MRARGDNCGLRSRIAAAANSGWTPRSSQSGYAARTNPEKAPKAKPPLDRGPGYRKVGSIRSWRPG